MGEFRATAFVLGTVQLGMAYGRRRGAPLMDAGRATSILDRAWELGVRAFDTAEAYGEAAGRLAAWIERRGHAAEVLTKVPDGPGLASRTAGALSRFRSAGARAVLSHGAIGPEAWAQLRAVATHAEAGAGQSVYDPDEVRAALALPGVGRVQVPR